ncbi:kanJ [Symbiodinium natans]|uniref:KanJ protein n=1 Tax=Symbiodinium natans TaxID=878477 RepID=A0A812MKS3_9DINO|nr:kanJ [Symbiodinium natans]
MDNTLQPWTLQPWPNYKRLDPFFERGRWWGGTLLSKLAGEIVLDPATEAFAEHARKAILDHGICILPSVLARESINRWKEGCHRLHQLVEEFGFSENRGHKRFSFGNAYKKGNCLHEPEWAEQIAGAPAVLQVLDAVWGRCAYRCCGGGGECVLPQCWEYQRLHSDAGGLDTNMLPPFLSVNFTVCDLTPFNGPTRHVPGTMRTDPWGVPCVQLENPRFLLSTVAPLEAGAAIIRDIRAWHGGTPNVTEVPRYLPSIEYEPSTMPMEERSLPRSVFCSLPRRAQELCKDIAAHEGEQIDCAFRNSAEEPAAKPLAKPAAGKPVAKTAAAKRPASPRPGPGRSVAATIARRLRAQAKSALQLPSVAKTKLCTFWLEGKCRRGEQCEFAHGVEEQLENCRRIPCRFHLGTVYPPSCKFAHAAAEGALTTSPEEVPEELAVDDGDIFESVSQSMAGAEARSTASGVFCQSDVVDVDQWLDYADMSGMKPQKTLLCKFWLRGKCQRTSGCAFAHGEDEQREACKRMRCRFDKEGFCKQGTACWYAHGEDAVEELEPDPGPLLPFAPGEAEPELPQPMLDALSSAASMRTSEDDPTKPQKTLLCRFWLKGKCLRLRDCAFAHGAGEQRAACAQIRCRFDREGFCKLGDACWYAHDGPGASPYTLGGAGLGPMDQPGPDLPPPPGLELPSGSFLRAPPGLDLANAER